ncbi:secernin-3 [Episyrphus balteatus]|uniref:secernin-3 n=1 Tax=Episyrphus balteatus TaxID=286459 RepID=UPI0024852EE5|nr:secernin-3 [Episyrphus balteatus]XP_055849770.1 secernin-3 [Episyrphus balteatus]
MSSSVSGDCFLVLTPYSQEKSLIFGRNSSPANGEAQEVLFMPSSASKGTIKCDGGAEIDSVPTFALVLQKPLLIWGAECGSNEKNVSIAILWSAGEPDSDALRSTDLVRLALERSCSSLKALNQIGDLVNSNGCDSARFSFLICDPTEAWLLSVGGKLWAAQKLDNGFQRLPSSGLGVTTSIDKSSEGLGDSLKSLGLWSGDGDLNFANCFSSPPIVEQWPGDEPTGDGSYIITSMFETLRSTATDMNRSSNVSVLSPSGISCYWFTATPNPKESVFKPFVFAPNPKISPLTKIPHGECITLLQKLHAQRKPEAVRDLKNLEASCVAEINAYFEANPTPTTELDELMKDCVEAEVKFYR